MAEDKEITPAPEKKDEDWPLPHCTKAPVAEHSRSADDDEPCDDSRGTIIEKKKDKK
jgi:hypothetical protein